MLKDEDFNKNLGKRILKYLELSKLTQQELADRLDVSPAAVSTWTLGQKTPRMSKVDKMCEIFGCTRNDLLDYGIIADSDYSPEERAVIKLYRQASAEKKHIVYSLLMLRESEGD